MSKLWGGRFTKKTDQLVEEYTASIIFDKELAEEDIQGSLAHVTMLGKCGILPAGRCGENQGRLATAFCRHDSPRRDGILHLR